MVLLESVAHLFSEKLTNDPREPIVAFEIPGFDGSFGLFAPLLEPWKQLLLVSPIKKCTFACSTCTLWGLTVSPHVGTPPS